MYLRFPEYEGLDPLPFFQNLPLIFSFGHAQVDADSPCAKILPLFTKQE